MEKFEVIKWANGIVWLKIDPKIIDEAILFAKENEINYFICHWHQLDEIEDFSILKQLDVLGLNITFSGIKSNEAINSFYNLKILICPFSEPITLLDFDNLTKLERLEITWNKKIKGLSSLAHLKDLKLLKYKPTSKRLEEFKSYEKIIRLTLVQPTIDALDGIQDLNQLIELEISRPKNLKCFFIDYSDNCLPNLKELTLSFCKELDYDTIPQLNNLLKLTISDGGDKIESLAFILEKMPHLEILNFDDTTLINGNLEYLLKHKSLKKVGIQHKKHYNMKDEEINAVLSKKTK